MISEQHPVALVEVDDFSAQVAPDVFLSQQSNSYENEQPDKRYHHGVQKVNPGYRYTVEKHVVFEAV